MEKAKNDTIEYLVEEGNDLEFMKSWAGTQKGVLVPFRDVRGRIKKQMERITDKETQQKLNRELYIQQEQLKFQHQQQKEKEEAALRQQQKEQEWYMQKMDMERQIQASHSGVTQETATQSSTQSVKLQKYTIIPFHGDYKD